MKRNAYGASGGEATTTLTSGLNEVAAQLSIGGWGGSQWAHSRSGMVTVTDAKEATRCPHGCTGPQSVCYCTRRRIFMTRGVLDVAAELHQRIESKLGWQVDISAYSDERNRRVESR